MKRFTVMLVLCGLAGPALAENVDPDNDGSQHAWAENVGWINAEPSGDGGPGVQVDDFALSGFMWGENVGWISLSCTNDASCGTTPYGVAHGGDGVLAGYAWSENLGWIDFAPSNGGVAIDPATGEFGGRAWGENVGWITFASEGASPYGIKTTWTCTVGAPAAPIELILDRPGALTRVAWSAPGDATIYDVVRGSLDRLVVTGGDFALATGTCLADDDGATSVTDVEDPAPGDGVWFLVRGRNCRGVGSWDSDGPGQFGSRDAGIAAAGDACP